MAAKSWRLLRVRVTFKSSATFKLGFAKLFQHSCLSADIVGDTEVICLLLTDSLWTPGGAEKGAEVLFSVGFVPDVAPQSYLLTAAVSMDQYVAPLVLVTRIDPLVFPLP